MSLCFNWLHLYSHISKSSFWTKLIELVVVGIHLLARFINALLLITILTLYFKPPVLNLLFKKVFPCLLKHILFNRTFWILARSRYNQHQQLLWATQGGRESTNVLKSRARCSNSSSDLGLSEPWIAFLPNGNKNTLLKWLLGWEIVTSTQKTPARSIPLQDWSSLRTCWGRGNVRL